MKKYKKKEKKGMVYVKYMKINGDVEQINKIPNYWNIL